jgi:hypothetical protein
MGHRTVKRVPLDFAWPLNRKWEGYLTPERFIFPKCRACDGTGESPEARAVSETFYPHQIGGSNAERLAWHDKIGQAEVDHLVERGRLSVRKDGRWAAPVGLTAAEVNAKQQGLTLGSHDAVNRWILVKFRCGVLGITVECPACGGEGDIATPEQREAADAWVPVDPSAGEGWQLWETTSEGSPVSPVFATAEELADWCEPHATLFASLGATRAEWLQMFREDTVDVGSLLTVTIPEPES